MRTITALMLTLLFVSAAAAQPEPAADLVDRERDRIRQHLAHVELTLRARDDGHLTDAQRTARAESLDRLHAYRERGEFPRNTRHPDLYLPYFIDDFGTACAVAQLVLDSGAEDLARRVASAENNAYVPDMTTPGLAEWGDAHGFTVDELAMIQPSYCGPAFDAAPCSSDGGSPVTDSGSPATDSGGTEVDASGGGTVRDRDEGCSVSAAGAPAGAGAGLSVLVALALAGFVRARR